MIANSLELQLAGENGTGGETGRGQDSQRTGQQQNREVMVSEARGKLYEGFKDTYLKMSVKESTLESYETSSFCPIWAI